MPATNGSGRVQKIKDKTVCQKKNAMVMFVRIVPKGSALRPCMAVSRAMVREGAKHGIAQPVGKGVGGVLKCSRRQADCEKP